MTEHEYTLLRKDRIRDIAALISSEDQKTRIYNMKNKGWQHDEKAFLELIDIGSQNIIVSRSINERFLFKRLSVANFEFVGLAGSPEEFDRKIKRELMLRFDVDVQDADLLSKDAVAFKRIPDKLGLREKMEVLRFRIAGEGVVIIDV